jgi:ribosome-binding factor A
MATRKRGGGGSRGYDRTDRLGELLREIIAEELEQIDDERLELVTVTSVDVDRELDRARVYYTTLSLRAEGSLSDEDDRSAEIAAALGEHRGRVRRAIGNQARVRRVPDVIFLADDAQASAMRIEQILQDLHGPDGDADTEDDGPQA